MTIKTILSAAILSGLTLSASTSATLASEVKSFKPIQGLSFDAGDKHAVGYFTNEAGRCQLVVTLAGEPNRDNGSLEITRYEASIAAGRQQRYENNGHAFEFGCADHAEAMTFKVLTTVAGDIK